MSRRARLRHEHAPADVVQREESDRVAVWLVEQYDVLAFDHPLPAEPHAHPPAKRLGEQQPLRQRISHEELAHRPGRQGSLLPCQAHHLLLSSPLERDQQRRVTGFRLLDPARL